METVKIDAQKLQLLNDRISQTIDALNQVRLSTHGLQHSGVQASPQWGQPQVGAFPQQAAAFYGQALPLQAIPAGIEHSTPAFGPMMGQAAFAPQAGQAGFAPVVGQGFGQVAPQAQFGYGTRGLGISHTQPTVDPYGQIRPQVALPYQQYATSPMISY